MENKKEYSQSQAQHSASALPANPKLVTIGVPIYKRLEYLPAILKMVAAQDYPAIELIVSDNGNNGTKVKDIVNRLYHRPSKVRQNAETVDVVLHHNQIIKEASGHYFHLLSDDDEISPNFVSDLVGKLEKYPEATLAYARLEIINNDGLVEKQSRRDVPSILSGPDFIRATWQRYEFGFHNLEGFLTHTKLWQDAGGYPDFTKGIHIDNAVVIKLCLNNHVVFSSQSVFRHRVHPEGGSWTISIKELASASKNFLRWLKRDPTIQNFAALHPDQWTDLNRILVRMTWNTYFWRWRDIYKDKLSRTQWIVAAFRMPFLPAYYWNVVSFFIEPAKAWAKKFLGNHPALRSWVLSDATKSSS